MKKQILLILSFLIFSITLFGCIFIPEVNRTYWFSEVEDRDTVLDRIAEVNHFEYQYVTTDLATYSSNVLNVNYAIDGVFQNKNQIDVDGSPGCLITAYLLDSSPAKAVVFSFPVLTNEVEYDLSYVETSKPIYLRYNVSIKGTETLDFTKDLIDNQSDYLIIYYILRCKVNEEYFEYGRIGFYYEIDSSRDEVFEMNTMDALIEHINFRIMTAPVSSLTT